MNIVTYVLSCTVSELGCGGLAQFPLSSRGVPQFNAVVGDKRLNAVLWNLDSELETLLCIVRWKAYFHIWNCLAWLTSVTTDKQTDIIIALWRAPLRCAAKMWANRTKSQVISFIIQRGKTYAECENIVRVWNFLVYHKCRGKTRSLRELR